jgi:hypothetical protein
MVAEKPHGFLADIEDKLGLPRLSRVTGALEKFPDAKQLRLIKDILATVESISRNAPEIDKVAILVQEINSMPVEKLEKLEKVLKRIERIMKNAPQELLEFLTSLK